MAGIYIHIPFCKTRCIYCDFYSTTLTGKKEQYINAINTELHIRKEYLKDEPVETIYFGGGTPSLLDVKDFRLIFDTIEQNFKLSSCPEITVEANPDDLSDEYLQGLSLLPFNRISIGIQTFNDRLLQLINRRHDSQQAMKAVDLVRKHGFHNISVDLMYGFPGQTPQEWENDLQHAIHLNPEHISAYHLIYEEGTKLWQLRENLQLKEIDEESSTLFFSTMIEKLREAGYIHYEISNFCKPDRYSRHNSSYWRGINYLGCGASAHSYNGDSRQWNVSDLDMYCKGIETGTPVVEKENLDIYTRYNDFIITTLRTMWGLPLDVLKENFGNELYEYCMENACSYLDSGKMDIKDNTLYIGKEGIFVSDAIMSDLLWVEDN